MKEKMTDFIYIIYKYILKSVSISVFQIYFWLISSLSGLRCVNAQNIIFFTYFEDNP